MPELRVAVAMGGGVSLGAFCGGALGEAVRRLVRHRAPEFETVRFDVFSGASAGAMSLGLLLHTLARPDSAGRPDAALQRQREAWVRRIDIRELIPDPATEETASLLDRSAVDRIARSLLAWDDGAAPASDLLGPRALFACTLANLNGIPVDGRKAGQGDAFLDALQTTLHEDLRVFDLRPGDPGVPSTRDTWLVRDDLARSSVWREIAATCVAAGAFPLAFEPVPLERTREEYGRLWPPAWDDRRSFPFTFADGGMFNNEPLREVMNLIHHADAEAGAFERVVLFIDPNLSGTREDLSLDYHRELELRDPDGTFGKLGRLFDGVDVEERAYVDRMTALLAPLAGAVRGQAAFKDWLAAEKVNNRLAWRDGLRGLLVDLLEGVPDEAFEGDGALRSFPSEARRRLRDVLEAKGDRSVRTNPELALDRERARLTREEADRLGTLAAGKREAALHLLSLVDQVAGLRGRMRVRVVGIGPLDDDGEPLELAGDHVANFGGFFDEAHRAHDFALGRERAGRVLQRAGLVRIDAEGPRRGRRTNGEGHRTVAADDDGDAGGGAGGDPAPVDERLLARIEHVVGDLLARWIDWPLGAGTLAVRLARRRLGRAVAALLSGDELPPERHVVRLEIQPSGDDDRFRLRGQGGGDALEARRAGPVAVAETLVVRREGGDGPGGPHVTRREGLRVLEVVRHRRFRRDERCFVALPDDDAFRTLERMGYGKLVARIDWADASAAAGATLSPRWRAVEHLEGWEAG